MLHETWAENKKKNICSINDRILLIFLVYKAKKSENTNGVGTVNLSQSTMKTHDGQYEKVQSQINKSWK